MFVASVVHHLDEQKSELREIQYKNIIEDFNTRLASVDRGISGEKYFDVRKLLVSKSELPKVSEKLKLFAEDGFYATADTSELSFSKTTELKLQTAITGLDSFEINPEFIKLSNQTPIYMWRAKSSLSVQNAGSIKSLFQFMIIERIPINAFAGLMRSSFDTAAIKSVIEKHDYSMSLAQYEDTLTMRNDKMFRGDIVGTNLAISLFDHLQQSITMQSRFEILNLQKVGNVLYMQSLETLNDATISGKLFSKYYIREETIYLSTSKDLYLIQIYTPSDDPIARGKAYAESTKWLSQIAILEDF